MAPSTSDDNTSRSSSSANGYNSAELISSSTIKSPDETKRTALDAALDAIINKKEPPTKVRLKFKLTVDELDEALLKKGAVDIVNHSRKSRRTRKPELAEHFGKAVDDVLLRAMSVRASAKLHGIHEHTLKKELIDRGVQLPVTRKKLDLEAAVRDVLENNLALKAAEKIYKVDPKTISKQLKAQGYVRSNPRPSSTWVKMSENSDDEPSYSAVECNATPAKQDGEDETQNEESSHVTKALANDEAIAAKEHSPVQDAAAEIEEIVDVRVKRQYLVKWQGETEEEATWVDEDVFLGLNRLNIA